MIEIKRSLIDTPEYLPIETFKHKNFNGEIVCSGSSGNMTIIDEKICIDAGVKVKTVKGLKLNVVLYTHRHGDHLQLPALKQIIKTNPEIVIFCNKDTHNKIVENKILHNNVIVINTGDIYDIEILDNKYSIQVVKMEHDVECHGFIIENQFGDRLLYATDTITTKHVPNDLKFDVVLLEANYCLKKIKEMIGIMKPNHRARLNENLSRHLSRQDNRLFLARQTNKDFYSYDMHKSGQFY